MDVVVGLATSGKACVIGTHGLAALGIGAVDIPGVPSFGNRHDMPRGAILISCTRITGGRYGVLVGRHLTCRQGDRFRSGLFSKVDLRPGVDGRAPAQIGKGERSPAVASESGAEKAIERLVLVDRKDLTVAKRPPTRGEVETNDRDLSEKGLRHCSRE